jgi:hypothetical protein
VFWALLLSFKHSRVPEDSKSPTLEVLGFIPTLGQSGVTTTLMNDIFREWLDDFVVIYIDDILIYRSSKEHAEHLRKVFQRLRENKLYAKLEKCKFGVTEVDFLGHRITQEGLMMDVR